MWSPDGRYLVTGHWRPETNELDALLVEIDSSDTVVGTPMVIEALPESWWNLSWLPDSEGFLVVSGILVAGFPGSGDSAGEAHRRRIRPCLDLCPLS